MNSENRWHNINSPIIIKENIPKIFEFTSNISIDIFSALEHELSELYLPDNIILAMIKYCLYRNTAKDNVYVNKILNIIFSLSDKSNENIDLFAGILLNSLKNNDDLYMKIFLAAYAEVSCKYPEEFLEEEFTDEIYDSICEYNDDNPKDFLYSITNQKDIDNLFSNLDKDQKLKWPRIDDVINHLSNYKKTMLDFYHCSCVKNFSIFSDRVHEHDKKESFYDFGLYYYSGNSEMESLYGPVFLKGNCEKINMIEEKRKKKSLSDKEYDILYNLHDISYKSVLCEVDYFTGSSFMNFIYCPDHKIKDPGTYLYVIASLVYLKTGIKFPIFECHNFYNNTHYVMILDDDDYTYSEKAIEFINHSR